MYESLSNARWGNVALSTGYIYDQVSSAQVFYTPDTRGHYVLTGLSLRKITRHWVLWGHKPYRSRDGFEFGDYELGAPQDYPWYSLAYHICRRGGRGDVADWDLMPEPDPLDEHPEVVQEVLSRSVVDEHKEAVARALGT